VRKKREDQVFFEKKNKKKCKAGQRKRKGIVCAKKREDQVGGDGEGRVEGGDAYTPTHPQTHTHTHPPTHPNTHASARTHTSWVTLAGASLTISVAVSALL
jgi:hypothetical protein